MSDKILLRNNVQNKDQYRNRGLDTKSEEISRITVSLIDIDTTIIKYMEEVIQPYVLQDSAKVSVPILYGSPERWKNIIKDSVLRDKRGKFQLPLIVIRRQSIARNELNNPINKYHEKEFVSTSWNHRNRYDRFAILNGIKESKRYVSVVYPDFYDFFYECIAWTEYQDQMNGLIEQISFETENYWGNQGQYRFKTSVDEYKNSSQLPTKTDRLVRSEFIMTVKAYLLPESTIDKFGKPIDTNVTRFTNKKIVIKETLI